MAANARTTTGSTTNPERTSKAVRQQRYGSPDVLELVERDTPGPAADEALIRVHAAGANPLDWHEMRGKPYVMRLAGSGLRKPKNEFRGVDVAGRVEAVGGEVTDLEPGDAVFGWCAGAFAEYASAPAEQFLPRPDSLTFVQAAAVPVAGMTALQALRDEADVRPGETLLINGASGGVGTLAVQIAAHDGAEVTGVCSTRNIELVRSLGAADVVDYTEADFTDRGLQYDVVLDLVANRSLSDLRRALAPDGRLVLSGGGGGPVFGPLGLSARAVLTSRFVGQRLAPFLAENDRADLATLTDLLEAGEISPVIDRTYPLAETADAIRYLEKGHARGKVVITPTLPDE